MSVEIKNLTVEYLDHDHRLLALDRVDLKLPPGKVTALVGESGSGKSTLAKAILGLLPENGSKKGEIIFAGQDISLFDDMAMNEIRWSRIAMVFQNGADNLNPVHRIADQVAEPLVQRMGMKSKEAKEKAKSRMEEMGLEKQLGERFPHELSGGQIQRALLAMALIMDPEILVLDEPTASLDAMTTSFIHSIIRDFAARGKTILLITHDLDLVKKTADQAAVLYLGQIMEYLPAEKIFHPCHPYMVALSKSFPGMDAVRDLGGIRGDGFFRLLHTHSGREGKNHTHTISKRHYHDDGHGYEEGCLFEARCTQARNSCSQAAVSFTQNGQHRVRCCRGGIVQLLQLSGVSKSYSSVCALYPTDLHLFAGEVFCLVGETGSGKSTLGMLAAASMDPDEGQRVFEDRDIKEWINDDYPSLASRIGVINQNPGKAVSHRLNVFDIVAEPLVIQKRESREERKRKVIQALEDVHLSTQEEFLKRYPHELNMGAVQRLCLARALVHEPDLLIADEPTSALDPSVQAKVLKMLLNLQIEKGLTMLFITHDIGLARKIGDRIGIMLGGRIVESGPATDIFSHPAHPYTRLLLDSARGKVVWNSSSLTPVTRKEEACPFSNRCEHILTKCQESFPEMITVSHPHHRAACNCPTSHSNVDCINMNKQNKSISGISGLRN